MDPSVFEANNVERPSCPSPHTSNLFLQKKAQGSCDQVHREQSPQTRGLNYICKRTLQQHLDGCPIDECLRGCVYKRDWWNLGGHARKLTTCHTQHVHGSHNWWWAKVRYESICNVWCHLYKIQEQKALIFGARSQIVVTIESMVTRKRKRVWGRRLIMLLFLGLCPGYMGVFSLWKHSKLYIFRIIWIYYFQIESAPLPRKHASKDSYQSGYLMKVENEEGNKETRVPCLERWWFMNSAGEGQLGKKWELCQLRPVWDLPQILPKVKWSEGLLAQKTNHELEDSKSGPVSQEWGKSRHWSHPQGASPAFMCGRKSHISDSKDFLVGELLWSARALIFSTAKWVSQRLGGANGLIYARASTFDV